jgi:succinate-acetate transporter protein
MPMIIQFDFSALRKTKSHEYAVRFLFGGAMTVIAGMLAMRYGPAFGGLFLAFPAIFPASATLIEKHESERKERAGIPQTFRGQQAAALDARGAMMGSLGLAGFAFAVWKLAPIWNGPSTLIAALAVWVALSILIWRVRRHRLLFRLRAR